MLTVSHLQEQLSKSYIIATAAIARVGLEITREQDYGVDGTLIKYAERNLSGTPGRGRSVENGIKLDFQIKCSTQWRFDGNEVAYSIESKTYNDIVLRRPHVPRLLLMLMCLPNIDGEEWHDHLEDSLTLRRCVYFLHLAGPPIQNERSTKLIRIPRQNVLTPQAVAELLEQEEARMEAMFA